MILVDSSVWAGHFRQKDDTMHTLLTKQRVMIHPMVIGELALGSLSKRQEVIELLQNLPRVLAANDDEMLAFIEHYALYSIGIGYIDAHLLAAAKLSGVKLWTKDKRLHEAAEKLGSAYHT